MAVTKDANGKRIPRSDRKFHYADGREPGQSPLGATMLRIEIPDGGVLEVKLDQFNEATRNALAWFGAKQVIGHAIGGADNGGEAFEFAAARIETLERGEWREGISGEARPSMLADALVAAQARKGKVTTQAAVLTWLSTQTEDQRKALLKMPEVKVEYETLKQAAAAKRLEEMRAKLGSTASTESSGFDSLSIPDADEESVDSEEERS